MQMKKLALAIIASGGCATALAQPSLGGSVPGAGSGSGMQGPGMALPEARSSSNTTFDAGPVAEGSTPRGSANAEFEIESFLSASVQAQTFSRSLEGLGQQTADFVSNQGGGSDGGGSDGGDAPAPPEGGGDQPAPPEGGDGGSEQPSPDTLTSMLPSGDGQQPQPPEGGDGGGEQPSPDMLTSMLPSGDGEQPQPPEGGDGGGEQPSQDTVTSLLPSGGGDQPQPPEGGDGGGQQPSPDMLTSLLPSGGGEQPQPPEGGDGSGEQPQLPEGGDGDEGGSEPQQASATVPDDLEGQSPAPTPFRASSLVSATVEVEAQDPSQ